MIWKLLGALSGAVLVGLWWLLVLEHPVLQQPAAAADQPPSIGERVGPQPTGRNREGPKLPLAGASRQPPSSEADSGVAVNSADPPPVADATPPPEPEPHRDISESVSPPSSLPSDGGATPRIATTANSDAEPSWHPLWNPFRSQASAQGFANHLSRLSGRRFSVEPEGPGQYRVHLAYQDATDLQLGLALIEEVSGLSPEPPP